MGWLQDRWGMGGPFGTISGALQGKQRSVNALRNDYGNMLKYGSDIAAPFTGPFAPLVAGAGNALGTAVMPGTNIGDIGKAGAIGAATGEAGHLLGSAFGAASGGAAGASGAAVPGDVADAASSAASSGIPGSAFDTSGNLLPGAAQGAGNASIGGGLVDNTKSALSDIGGWISKHPEAVGQGLSAIGNAPLNEAKAKQMAAETMLLQQQSDRQKSLDPLRRALAGALQNNMMGPRVPNAQNPYNRQQPVAPNPYVG